MRLEVTLDFGPGLLAWLKANLVTKADLQHLEARIMAAIDDKVAALTTALANANTSADTAIARVTTDLAGLKTQIDTLTTTVATLQAQVDAGGASQATLDALDAAMTNLAALQAKYDALDFTNPAVLPPTP